MGTPQNIWIPATGRTLQLRHWEFYRGLEFILTASALVAMKFPEYPFRKRLATIEDRNRFQTNQQEERNRMKSYIAIALAFAVAANAFAEQVLYCAGTVRYPSGKPAAGVRVEYYPGHHNGAGDYAEAKTDSNGRYEIIGQKDERIYWGVIIKTNSIMARDGTNNLAVVQDVFMTVTNVDLVLQPAITLSGSVKNTEGAPIAEANAQYFLMFSGPMRVLGGHPIKVNELGQFSMSALPQGRPYHIYVGSAKGYGVEDADIQLADTWSNRYEFPPFVLEHADQKIAGRVLDENGKPFAAVEVSFSGKGQPMNSFDKWSQEWLCNTKTDGNGSFSFDAVCEGQLQIHADTHKAGGNTFQEVHPGATNIIIRLPASSR
jgi:5-hydroxyisourate hydrolase-like protein (transthyretin family)